jgi:hypothetical protein
MAGTECLPFFALTQTSSCSVQSHKTNEVGVDKKTFSTIYKKDINNVLNILKTLAPINIEHKKRLGKKDEKKKATQDE